MNNIHRTIWNCALGAWVAAPETARARGRRAGCTTAHATALLLAAGILPAGSAWADYEFAYPFTLNTDVTFNSAIGDNVRFESTVDGAYALSLNTSGTKTFGAAVGGTTALTSFISGGGGSTVLYGNVTTNNSQSYQDALTLGANVTLSSTAGDNIAFSSTVSGTADLTVRSTLGLVQFADAVNLRNLTVEANDLLFGAPTVLSGNLSITSGQTYAQTAAFTVGGTSSFSVGNGGGTIDLNNAANVFAGAIIFNAGNVSLTNSIATVLGNSTIGNALSATSGGAITQTGALSVAGLASFNAGSSAITLNSPGNSFGGALDLTGGAISVASQGDMTVGSLSQAANSALSLVAGGVLSLPNAPIDTGSAAMSLRSNGGSLTTAGNLSGSQIDLASQGAITLVHDVTTPGTLRMNSGTTILQAGGAVRAGTLTGTSLGDTTLDSAANFVENIGNFYAANFDLRTATALTVTGTLSAGNISLESGTGTTVVTGAVNASGHTTINTGTTLQIGTGGTQGSISGDVVNNGTLTFDRSGTVTLGGAVSGAGSLVKGGTGILTLSGSSSYAGGTKLLAGRINVGSNSALGTGALDMADGTTLGFSANNLNLANDIMLSGVGDPIVDTGSFDATLSGAISGTGFLTKEGSGALTLTGANNYSGPTTVSAGTLRAGSANTFSGASSYTVASGATLDTAGFNQTIGVLTNSGTISLLSASAGSTLTVNGNYVGNNGLLKIGTVLGDNSSMSDHLVITGSASGTTRVQVSNLSGLGGQTTGDGIQIVSAAGGIASGAFSLAGTLSAGAYDYRLNTTSGAAFLSSTVDVAAPTTPTAPPSEAPTAAPTPVPAPVPTYRAEAPLLAAAPEQLREAGLAMVGNLHQRVGDEGRSGTTGGQRQAWGRYLSVERNIAQEGTVSATSNGRQSGVQVGTDLWGNPSWRAGVYVGQLEGDLAVTGFARGARNYAAGSNDLRSQFLGGYATWRNDGGTYVDAVLQAGRLRYTANPAAAASADGKGSSVLASVEVGQALQIAPGWTVEPQLQLASQHMSLDDLPLAGAAVQQDNDSAWLARIGVRVKGEVATSAGMLQPYARMNLYRRGSGTDTARFIGPAATTDIRSSTGGTSTELAVGATWQITPLVAAYGEVGHLWADSGAARTEGSVGGSLGLKVNW